MTGYPYTLPYLVRVADINYGGHVSNAAVLNYFQDARIGLLAALGPYSELDVGQGRGLIMRDAYVRYRVEMRLGDPLLLGVRVVEVKGSSFRLGYRIDRGEQVMAEGTTELACFDYATHKPSRLPEPFRQALQQALEGAL